jgi:tRNA threonylcarbamoyladenosine biosynthesis protein TsaE
MPDQTFITSSEDETADVGRGMASALRPGDTVLLFGELGAGKTALVRGIAVGLGVPADEVSSPTFTLVQEYAGRLHVFHVDLYRLRAGPEVWELDLEGFREGGGVLLIEWADRVTDPPIEAVRVSIEDLGGDRRRISVRTSAPDSV